MNVWSSRSDIEKYIMAKIVELDKQAEPEKSPTPITFKSIIPDEWFSSSFKLKLNSVQNNGDVFIAKNLSPIHSNFKSDEKRRAYIYHLEKALLIAVTLLERLNDEKHIIFVRKIGGRDQDSLILGSNLDDKSFNGNSIEIKYIELVQKLIFITSIDIVPMSSLIDLVERDFKTDSQIDFEAQEIRHKEILNDQKNQNIILNAQQRKSFRLAIWSIIIASLSVTATIVSQFMASETKIVNDPINVNISPNKSAVDSLEHSKYAKTPLDSISTFQDTLISNQNDSTK